MVPWQTGLKRVRYTPARLPCLPGYIWLRKEHSEEESDYGNEEVGYGNHERGL